MTDVTCPYCDNDFELNHDDGAYYDENKEEPTECPKCEKSFVVNTCCLWIHQGIKADCLNDGIHNWKKIHGSPEFVFINRRRCSMCDKEMEYKKTDLEYQEPVLPDYMKK